MKYFTVSQPNRLKIKRISELAQKEADKIKHTDKTKEWWECSIVADTWLLMKDNKAYTVEIHEYLVKKMNNWCKKYGYSERLTFDIT